MSAYYLEGLTCTNNMEGFFFRKKKLYQGLGVFFATAKTTNLSAIFWAPEFYTSFQGWLFNFNVILKTCFKIFLEKLWKNGDFK